MIKAQLFAGVAVLALGAASAAQAQQQPSEVNGAVVDAYVGEQITDVITVTTQKREQSLADVPINLTAYDARRMEILDISQFDELSDFVPGLEIQEQSPNNPGFVIRGITSDDGGAAVEPRVAVFQDGVSISKSRGSYVELFDMERVEIAKGPQPTLFGRGALIGGINLIQNKADMDGFAANIEAGIGDYDRYEIQGMVNYALSDTMAFRLAGIHKERDGYIDNTLGGTLNSEDVSAVRAVFSWEPMAALHIDVIGNYQEDKPEGTSFKSGTFAPLGGQIEPWEPAALNTFGGFEGGRDLGLDRKVYGITVLADYDLNDAWSVSSITGWRAFESLEVFDPDGFDAELLVAGEDATGDQWSQEVRFNYDAGGPLKAFLGGSYFYESGNQRIPLATNPRVAQAINAGRIAGLASQALGQTITVDQIEQLMMVAQIPGAQNFDNPYNPLGIFVPSILPQLGQVYGAIQLGRPDLIPGIVGTMNPVMLDEFYLEETANFADTTAWDIFGEVSYSVTDRLELTAGLRWTKEEKNASVYGRPVSPVSPLAALTPGTPTVFIPATPGGAQIESGEKSFDDFTWRLAANYALSDTANIWASYARGRRPDVISYSAGKFVIVDAEIVDSYEVGMFRTWDNTTFQGSIFYSQYENFQSSSFIPGQATYVTTNAGNATQYGLEGQFDHQFNEILTLFATYAYNFAEFDDKDSDGNKQQYAGNMFRLSPEHAFSLGLNAEFPLGNGGTLSLIPTYSWQSKVFFDNANDLDDAKQDEVQGDYGIWNARMRYEAPEQRYYAEVYVKNLADEKYIIDAGNTGDNFGIPTFIAGAPRMIGLRVGANF